MYRLIIALSLFLSTLATAQATRPVPGRMELGVNVDENRAFTNAGAWADLAHAMSGWFNNAHYTADSYPMDNGAQCNCQMIGQPAGTYKMTWEGTATIAAKSLGAGQANLTVTGATTQPSKPGVVTTTADLVITAPNNQFFFTVTGLDPAKPLANMHIYSSGYAGTGKVFRDEFTKWLTPFTTVRMIDWANVNVDKQASQDAFNNKPGSDQTINQPIHWADRVTPTKWDQTSRGVAYEYQMALAVQTGATWWVSIPYMADDDYIRQLGNLIATAPPGLKIVIELSNEVWNSGFGQWLQNFNRANDITQAMQWDGDISTGTLVHFPNGQLGTDGNTRAARCYADRARQVSMILRTQLGSHRFSMTLAGQAMWTFWLQAGLDWVQARYGDVDRVYDSIAVAPYWPISNPNQGTPLATIAQQTRTFITGDLNAALLQHKALAAKYGLGYVCYEGGQNFAAWFNGPPWAANDFPAILQTDPAIGPLYDASLASASGAGVTLYMHNSFIRPWVKAGMYALQQSVSEAPGPKWLAMARFAGTTTSQPAPPVTQPATQPAPFNGTLTIGGVAYQVIDGRIYNAN